MSIRVNWTLRCFLKYQLKNFLLKQKPVLEVLNSSEELF